MQLLCSTLLAALTVYAMTARFYEKMFLDPHLDRFVRSHKDPHGNRLGNWMLQKLGYGPVWTEDLASRSEEPVTLAGGRKYVVHDRTSAHHAAWHCVKREKEAVGRRFKVDDCRIWMRLMFWSAREEGLLDVEEFTNWFVPFISHFIAVYEWSAPRWTDDSVAWSADPRNIEAYLEERRMDLG